MSASWPVSAGANSVAGWSDVPEQDHQCLQGHAGVGQRGGVGVPQLVRDDPHQGSAEVAQVRGRDRGKESVA